jgi:hypothetical protein
MDKLQEWRKTMARVIGFYIPDGFQKRAKWVSAEQRGEVIEMRVVTKAPDSKMDSEVTPGVPSLGLVNASEVQQWNSTGVRMNIVPLITKSTL